MNAGVRGPDLRRRWVIVGLTALAFVLGPVVTFFIYGALGFLLSEGATDMQDFPYSEQLIWTMMWVDCLAGLAAVGLLPLALRRAPEPRSAEAPEPSDDHRMPEPWTALLASILIGLLTMVSMAALPAWFIAVISVSSRGIRWWIYTVPPVALIAAAGQLFLIPQPESSLWETLVLVAMSLVITALPIVIGLLRWTRRRQMRALRAEAATARREAEAVVREEQARAAKTRAEERTRIAREMHDTLSHRLALISTYAGALDYREDLDRETVRSTARLVQQTASTASAELRTVLDVLREDPSDTRPEPDLTQVDRLIEEIRSTGVSVDMTMARRDLADLPDTTSRALYRMLQEALTNAVKHAPGAPVSVTWAGDDDEVHLAVSNPLASGPSQPSTPFDPAGRAEADKPGFGLVGLDERARALGGTVRTTKTAQEFRLEAAVPCRS